MSVTVDTHGCLIKEIIFDGHNMIQEPPYSAAVIGRIAGRISYAEFFLNGVRYELPKNENENCLHGNHEFDRQAEWEGHMEDNKVILTYDSPDGSNGFPGNVRTTVTYSLDDNNTLRIDYYATTDKDTIFNLTNHAYFNLNDDNNTPITNHILTGDAKYYIPLLSDLTPEGYVEKTVGSIFDIREGKLLKDVVESTNSQIVLAGNGYDHALVFGESKVASLYSPETGRKVTMETDYPCFVCYSGNQMKGDMKHCGICLEAQLLPDAINHDGFGEIELTPGEPYKHFVAYRFSRD